MIKLSPDRLTVLVAHIRRAHDNLKYFFYRLRYRLILILFVSPVAACLHSGGRILTHTRKTCVQVRLHIYFLALSDKSAVYWFDAWYLIPQ
jgi:hypothetical protein